MINVDDGDGVSNKNDNCAGTPAGTKVDANGCPVPKPADDDGDGVPNGTDKCPATAAGATVDADGCSAAQKTPADDDGDGVPNSIDKCPATAKGAAVDANGCSADQRQDNHQTVVVHPTQPDVDVNVTTPNTGPAVVPTSPQPVIVNSSGPGSAPNQTAGPPVINVTLPSQPQTQMVPVQIPATQVQMPATHVQTHKPRVQRRPQRHRRHVKRHRRHRRHHRA